MWNLVPWSGIRPGSPHWEPRVLAITTRGVLKILYFKKASRWNFYYYFKKVGLYFLKQQMSCGYQGKLPARHKEKALMPKVPLLQKLCDPRDGSLPGSSVPGILQARTLEWVAIPFSKVSTYPLSNVSSMACCNNKWYLLKIPSHFICVYSHWIY